MLHKTVGAQENSNFAFLNILDFFFFTILTCGWLNRWTHGYRGPTGILFSKCKKEDLNRSS